MAIAEKKSASVEQVLTGWKEQGIRNVRFELPDMHGTSRSKLVPIEHAARYASDGLNMYGGAAVLDSRSDVVPGTLYNEEVAYADQLLYPDPSTAAIVPWLEATGRFICDAKWADGKPLAASPRHVFARVLERSRQLGYEPVMGMESEFYLLDAETRKPLFEGYQIFNSVRNTWVPAIERIVGEMREYGIDIITANCEYAGSQWEINYAPGRGGWPVHPTRRDQPDHLPQPAPDRRRRRVGHLARRSRAGHRVPLRWRAAMRADPRTVDGRSGGAPGRTRSRAGRAPHRQRPHRVPVGQPPRSGPAVG